MNNTILLLTQFFRLVFTWLLPQSITPPPQPHRLSLSWTNHAPLPPHVNGLLRVVPRSKEKALWGCFNHTAVRLSSAEVLWCLKRLTLPPPGYPCKSIYHLLELFIPTLSARAADFDAAASSETKGSENERRLRLVKAADSRPRREVCE